MGLALVSSLIKGFCCLTIIIYPKNCMAENCWINDTSDCPNWKVHFMAEIGIGSTLLFRAGQHYLIITKWNRRKQNKGCSSPHVEREINLLPKSFWASYFNPWLSKMWEIYYWVITKFTAFPIPTLLLMLSEEKTIVEWRMFTAYILSLRYTLPIYVHTHFGS